MELSCLLGVGPKIEELLNKLNIYTVEDLVRYYPYRYDIIEKSDMDDIGDGDRVVLDGVIECRANVMYISKKLRKTSFRINNGSNIFSVIFYNQIYLSRLMVVGNQVTVIGKYDWKKKVIVATDVRNGLLNDKTKIESVYYKTFGLSRNVLSKFIREAIDCLNVNDISLIPKVIENKYGFLNTERAINEIHFPKSIDMVKKAIIRFKYEELFIYMLRINYLKMKNKMDKNAIEHDFDREKIDEVVNKLPFSLTIDQKQVLDEILNDLGSKKRMNRLLQGDVGSGKTIVALLTAYANFLSGYQTALMVPSELLAIQHYQSFRKILDGTGVKIVLLTSSTKIKEKKAILSMILEGTVDIVIGTQSLIQDKIVFNNLGLVITDEQHRFGVNQRDTFKNKGIVPDILSMSATPIPRTYALTIYGDLDISSIKTKPFGRKSIITKIYQEKDIISVLREMKREIDLDHQIYIIAPLIEENDDLESVQVLEKKMCKAFPNGVIKSVHGKLNKLEKEKIMNEFNEGSINILISTTVIEVGIDVKNASMIIIFDANKFGLSTLHQLRGRVGRSDIQSYCILVEKCKHERLKILEKTSDGFEVSEFDFTNRGEGDLFGTRQSGINTFKIANLQKDFKILLQAKTDVEKFLQEENLFIDYYSTYHGILQLDTLN